MSGWSGTDDDDEDEQEGEFFHSGPRIHAHYCVFIVTGLQLYELNGVKQGRMLIDRVKNASCFRKKCDEWWLSSNGKETGG